MKSTKATISAIITLAFAFLLSLAFVAPAALATNGDLDPSFGGDGKVTTDFIQYDAMRDIAIQPDGKIVAVGYTYVAGTPGFALARYNPDGSLDTSFSNDGLQSTDISTGDDVALNVAIRPDGKILTVGYCLHNGIEKNALVRYNSDGTLDTTFGAGTGKVCGPWFTHLSDVALLPDGKILASGYVSDGSVYGMSVYRFFADGSLDEFFGEDGNAYAPFLGLINAGNDIAVQPDGKILVAGTAEVDRSTTDFALARFSANGILDTSFSGDGMVTTDFAGGDDAAYTMALNPDGRIYLAGSAFVGNQGDNFGMARYNSDGTLDTTFGGDGLVDISIMPGQVPEGVGDIVIQPGDGKLVAAGYTQISAILNFAVLRVNTSGSLDQTFGTGGYVFHNFGSDHAVSNGIVLQSDGKIVAGGTADMGTPNSNDFALARYLVDGAPTPTPVPSATPTNTRTSTPTAPPSVTPTPTACTIEFTDVPQGSTFYNFVHCIACRGIIGGYETGCEAGSPCFRPNNNLTRGQLSKIVSNAAGFSENYVTSTFEDVPVGSTFHQFAERLADRSIIGGYACGGAGEPCGAGNKPYFRPNANVTRGQTSKIVAIAGNIPPPQPNQQSFEDVPTTHTFWQWIGALYLSDAISGYICGGVGEPCGSDNLPYFRPNNNVTRGQSSKIITLAFFPACGEQVHPNK